MEQPLNITDTSFPDSRFKSFTMLDNGDLIVYLISWQEKEIKITFLHVIQFSYKLGDVTQGLYEMTTHSSFLEEALRLQYIKVPDDHPYRYFQIQDIDDFPYIEVVAEGVDVIS